MMDDNPDLAAAFPREGTNRFVDAMCIPLGAKNKEAAELYINFLCEPEVAAANADYIGYSTPNAAAFELLDEETRNSISYPSDEILSRSESFVMLPEELSLAMDEAWKELLSDDQSFENLLMPLVLGFAVLAIVLIVTRRVRKMKRDASY
jgi:spermidine/putrescine transport system substrate-binding protein